MGVGIWIGPLDKEAKDRLRQSRINIPRRLPASGGPTPSQLRKTLEKMEGFVASFFPDKPTAGDDWCIRLTLRKKPKTGLVLLSIIHLKSMTSRLPILFLDSARADVAALLAVELAKSCGPQVLDGEDSYGVHFVDGRCSPDDLLVAMEKHARRTLKGSQRD